MQSMKVEIELIMKNIFELKIKKRILLKFI